MSVSRIIRLSGSESTLLFFVHERACLESFLPFQWLRFRDRIEVAAYVRQKSLLYTVSIISPRFHADGHAVI